MGMPSVFVRIAGCDLHCHWCDTSYAQHVTHETSWLSLDEISEHALLPSTHHVVITGGEPTQYPDELIALCDTLTHKSCTITLETNATSFVPCACALASLSPKLPSKNIPQSAWNDHAIEAFCAHAPQTQIKVVVHTEDDVHDAAQRLCTCKLPSDHIFMMPASRTATDIISAAEWLVPLCAHYGFRFGARLHTLMWHNTPGK